MDLFLLAGRHIGDEKALDLSVLLRDSNSWCQSQASEMEMTPFTTLVSSGEFRFAATAYVSGAAVQSVKAESWQWGSRNC